MKNSTNINTTINIRPELRAKIYEIFLLFDIPVCKIIALLIFKIIQKTEIRMFLDEIVRELAKDIKRIFEAIKPNKY